MKNIEKYTNTKDALEAYNQPKYKNVPFDKWLDGEYEEPRVPTLLEAAADFATATTRETRRLASSSGASAT